MEGGRLCGQARARVARRLRDVRRALWTGILEVGVYETTFEGHWNSSVVGRQVTVDTRVTRGQSGTGGKVSTHKMGKEDHSAAAHNGKWGRLAGRWAGICRACQESGLRTREKERRSEDLELIN